MEPKIAWPVAGLYPISFRFGEAPKWYTDVFGYPHNGIDIACPEGTLILACDNGEVIFADDVPDADGKGLILKHEWGLSLYWHLSTISAGLGNRVEKGAGMAQSGRTGYVTGPHLHFAIKVFGHEVPAMRGWADPLRFLETTQPAPAPPMIVPKWHLVLPGDTLWSIAAKHYGNGLQWRRIYEANRDKISNPNLIRPFMKLLVP